MSVRPGMYLGAEDVRTLDTFVAGYTQARSDLGLPEYGIGEERLLAEFHRWLERELGRRSNLGWHSLIEHADASEKNVHTFIKLFDRFLKEVAGFPDGLLSGV
jgi:hypothetical protein